MHTEKGLGYQVLKTLIEKVYDILGPSANLNYYLFNGNVDLRKGIFRLCESIREEMSLAPSDASMYICSCQGEKND